MEKSKGMNIKLQAKLTQRLREEGWGSILEFTRKSGVGAHFTQETTRRVFNACEDKNVSPSTLAVVMYFLNYTPTEIKELLQKYTDDQIFYKLIGDTNIQMSLQEQALHSAFNKIVTKTPENAKMFYNCVEMAGMAAGVDLNAELKVLKKK